MVISYDISNDKLRTVFAKYLSRFGHRIQYSVFEIDNSDRILENIMTDIKNKFEKSFSNQIVLLFFRCLPHAKYIDSVMRVMMIKILYCFEFANLCLY